jgi:hypothetical protein
VEVDDRLKDYLPSGSRLSVEDWVSQQPEGISPTVIDPRVDPNKAFDAGAAAFQARMEQTQLHQDDELNRAEERIYGDHAGNVPLCHDARPRARHHEPHQRPRK